MATKNNKNKKKKKTKTRKPGKSHAKRAAKSKAAAKAPVKKPAGKKKTKARPRGKSENVGTVVYEPKGLGGRSAGQGGDLQGLSGQAGAGDESVDELLEEGNAFEAGVIKGVEDVVDEEEVHTHEVPEEDVPEEYRDIEE